jgi:hypothetical protein
MRRKGDALKSSAGNLRGDSGECLQTRRSSRSVQRKDVLAGAGTRAGGALEEALKFGRRAEDDVAEGGSLDRGPAGA